MSKWVNIYLLLLLINLAIIIFFKPLIIIALPLAIVASIVIYMSKVNKTTSLVHIAMFIIAMIILSLSIWSGIYE